MSSISSPVEDVSPMKARPCALTAAGDLLGGLKRRELWGRLGWLDVKRRYRRTIIGPFWTSITLAVYVGAVGTVGAAIWHQDIHEYLPFLVSGMIAWTFVSTIIIESCSLFIASQSLFKNIRFEYSVLVYAMIWRNLIFLLHNFVVYFVVVLFLNPSLLEVTALLVVPGIILITLNAVWVALLLGMLCLLFRDIPPLINSLLQVVMLITPLFWPADTLVGVKRHLFVEPNPLYHVLDLVRAPLLGKVPETLSYVAVIGMAISGLWLSYLIFERFRARIAYWS